MKTTKMILALVAGLFLMSGTAFAFHDGGVAHCDGCHSMHNSADNPRSGSAMSDDLMKGSDPSSTCLNCHAGAAGSYHIKSDVGNEMKAGGDYFWITAAAEYDTSTGHYSPNLAAENKGHNVIAADFGMAMDTTNTVAPGGVSPSNTLGCNSCHDPHGQVGTGGTGAIVGSGSYGGDASLLPAGEIYGNYRILEDSFAPVPVARASSFFGPNAGRVDYGQGMSGWCIGCHLTFGDTNMHPTDEPVPVSYNAYVKTGDFTGNVATAYDGLVPFERGVADGSQLNEMSTVGVTGTDQVMCLSCHRSHASAFPNALRWDNGVAFMAESAILNEASTTLVANGAIPYYANGAAVDMVATYGEYQRQMCNKCHSQD